MRIDRDDITDVTIRQVERGSLRIGNEVITGPVALTADTIIRDWPAIAVEDLEPADLDTLLEWQPEVIVVGAGWRSVLPPQRLVFAMARRGIGIEFMDTPAAARTFNILVAEGRRPAAILLLGKAGDAG
ncbi:MAG TPA: MTH938/NDUFAF3 family protein [Woeseiaceae bacterium]|nr:MTH938/NDUFAF3 family protein [Woeseiaceae bacterium]